MNLEATDITRRAGGRTLLDHVSLALGDGDRLVVTGPVGSGKTLLLRALAWLDPLDEGIIRWNGRAVGGSFVPRYRRHVVYVHQRPVFLAETVRDEIKMARRRHAPETTADPPLSAWLARLGLSEAFLDRPTGPLSGGQRQLAALLRTLALDPHVLLLDEPTASLDAAAARAVESLLVAWVDGKDAGPERGVPELSPVGSAGAGPERSLGGHVVSRPEAIPSRAFVWVTHDQGQAERVGQTVRRLVDGRWTDMRA